MKGKKHQDNFFSHFPLREIQPGSALQLRNDLTIHTQVPIIVGIFSTAGTYLQNIFIYLKRKFGIACLLGHTKFLVGFLDQVASPRLIRGT